MVPTSFAFIVPGAPIPKARVARVMIAGKMRGVTEKRTRSFEALVRLVAASARPSGWPMHCEYSVRIHAVRARRRRGDNSNLAKGVEDACNTVVWADDEQIAELNVTRALDPDNARTEVSITALAVRCSVATCGALTFFPVEKRCEACAPLLAAKRAARATPTKRAPRARRA